MHARPKELKNLESNMIFSEKEKEIDVEKLEEEKIEIGSKKENAANKKKWMKRI